MEMNKHRFVGYTFLCIFLGFLMCFLSSCSTIDYHDYYDPELHEKNFEKCRIEIGQEHRNTMEWQRCMAIA